MGSLSDEQYHEGLADLMKRFQSGDEPVASTDRTALSNSIFEVEFPDLAFLFHRYHGGSPFHSSRYQMSNVPQAFDLDGSGMLESHECAAVMHKFYMGVSPEVVKHKLKVCWSLVHDRW